MNWLKKLHGPRLTKSGLEWRIWCKLPRITLVGTLVPALVWFAFAWSLDPDASARQARWLLMAGYVAWGAVIFHWTMVLTLAIGCAIVLVMKGPAYSADAYPLSDSEVPSAGDKTTASNSIGQCSRLAPEHSVRKHGVADDDW